ncbi:MAG: hypothetical protein Fur0024_1510 [Patescibacteria group bacterium]
MTNDEGKKDLIVLNNNSNLPSVVANKNSIGNRIAKFASGSIIPKSGFINGIEILEPDYSFLKKLIKNKFSEKFIISIKKIDWENGHEIGCRIVDKRITEILLYKQNVIKELDVSQLEHLKILDCWGTSISKISLLKNKKLEKFFFSETLIKEIDLSKNENLTYIQGNSFFHATITQEIYDQLTDINDWSKKPKTYTIID